MTTALTPVAEATAYANDTTHVICCDLDTALCGQDVSDTAVVAYGVGHDCIVCLDLESQPCPRCGYNPAEENCL